MPLYEYECSGCGAGFEIFQSMTENMESPPTDCPNCKQENSLYKYLGNCNPAYNIQGEGVYRRGWQ